MDAHESAYPLGPSVGTTPSREQARTPGPFGLWTHQFDQRPARRVAEVLAVVEGAGVPAVWPAARARAIARDDAAHRLERDAYRGLVFDLGFTAADLEHGGSDRVIDAVVACVHVDTVVQRVVAHRAAGAAHVGVAILNREGVDLPVDARQRLAPAPVDDLAHTGQQP